MTAAVACLQHAVVKVKIFFTDRRAARRVEFHVAVPEVIDGVEIDGAKVPRYAIHQPCGSRMNIGALSDDARRRVEAVIALLIDFRGTRHERFDQVERELFRIQTQRGEGLAKLRRMHHAGHELEIRRDAVELVGDHGAVDRFGGIAGPPADHNTAFAVLSENIPKRFAGAREVGNALYAAPIRTGFHEAVNAMVEGALAGSDGGPQHWRKRRLERGDRGGTACAYEAAEVGHPARLYERANHLPVGRVPSDQKHPAAVWLVACLGVRPGDGVRHSGPL